MVETEKPKSGCLTAYLVVVVLFSFMGGMQYLTMGPAIQRGLSQVGMHVAGWYYPVMGVISLVNVAAALGMWKWKKWGVYLYVGMGVLGILLSIAAGAPPVMAIASSLIGFAVLYFLLRNLWESFE